MFSAAQALAAGSAEEDTAGGCAVKVRVDAVVVALRELRVVLPVVQEIVLEIMKMLEKIVQQVNSV